MKKLGVAAIALVALVTTAAALAAVTKGSYSYKATMTPKQEVPKATAPAKAGGSFTATVTESGTKWSIRWTLTFRNLSGKAGAAHIHMGKPGTSGAVLFGLCSPCKSGANGRASISKDVADALEHGNAYVNVHTAKNPPGEIRGAATLVGHS